MDAAGIEAMGVIVDTRTLASGERRTAFLSSRGYMRCWSRASRGRGQQAGRDHRGNRTTPRPKVHAQYNQMIYVATACPFVPYGSSCRYRNQGVR